MVTPRLITFLFRLPRLFPQGGIIRQVSCPAHLPLQFLEPVIQILQFELQPGALVFRPIVRLVHFRVKPLGLLLGAFLQDRFTAGIDPLPDGFGDLNAAIVGLFRGKVKQTHGGILIYGGAIIGQARKDDMILCIRPCDRQFPDGQGFRFTDKRRNTDGLSRPCGIVKDKRRTVQFSFPRAI